MALLMTVPLSHVPHWIPNEAPAGLGALLQINGARHCAARGWQVKHPSRAMSALCISGKCGACDQDETCACRCHIVTDPAGPHLDKGQSLEDFCDAYQRANW